MDVPAWVRYCALAVGAVLTGVCTWFVVRSIRRLNQGIEEFEAEMEARQGAPLDPYSALAEIYAEQRPRKKASEPRKNRG